jgi:hypothetical protein
VLTRGLDANTREKGDNTCAMHWAAASATSTSSVVWLMQVATSSGTATIISWSDRLGHVLDGQGDGAHRAVADFLVSRGARHHVFAMLSIWRTKSASRWRIRQPSTRE